MTSLQPLAPAGLDLEVATVAELREALDSNATTSVELVTAYVARIDAVDRSGPGLTAVRLVAPDAVVQAEAADERRRRGEARGPLDGIPVLVKDNIDVAGLPTTAGAVALADNIPDRDAPLVTRLRDGGAVILGKTNLSEMANFLTESMPSGYSSLGGQVLNPYDTTITPSGSSSGTGAALAVGLAAVGVGTETDGSITSPSSACALVGLKPTVGLVSRTGIVPIAASQDTAGPMCRTVADAAVLLAALAGPDPEDEATTGQPDPLPDYVAAASTTGGLRNARLGVVRVAEGGIGGEVPLDEQLHAAALEAAAGAGAVLESDIDLPELPWEPELYVLRWEFERDADAYFSRLPEQAPVRSLQALREWNVAHADVALKYGQVHVDAACDIDHDATREDYERTRREDQQRCAEGLEAVLIERNVEALVFPAASGCSWAARAGWPSLVLPVGLTRHGRRPVGLMLVARPWQEARLLEIAADWERVLPRRQPPTLTNPAIYRGTPLAR
ncbi:MAG: amidase family protein [Actinomycetes bacterium]